MQTTCRPRAVPLALALLALALAGGCSRDGDGGGGFSMPPMPVETVAVEVGPVVDLFTTVGTLEAEDAVEIVTEIDGRVTTIPFDEGQPLARGDLIAQLDDVELRAQAARAEAIRDQMQATFERVRSVVSQGAGAPQDLDDAAADLKVAEAELDLARARLAKTHILAPFAGIAGTRRVSEGAFVRSGTVLTDLARISDLRVIFFAPERHLARLRRGAEVQVSTTAYPDHVQTGRIAAIEPQLDPTTRSARVVARISNPGDLLRPGMSADVAVVLAAREQALTIPSEAIFIQSGQTLVYVVGPDSTVAPRPVSLGTRLAERVEILDGLAAGTTVVRAGHQKLFPGAKVLPHAAGAPPAAGPGAGGEGAAGQTPAGDGSAADAGPGDGGGGARPEAGS